MKEFNRKEVISSSDSIVLFVNVNGVEKKFLIFYRVRESIVEFLKVLKLFFLESKKKVNGEIKVDVVIINGDISDGLRLDLFFLDENDDDLLVKEKLIVYLRNELR